jgi:hypothetical protein
MNCYFKAWHTQILKTKRQFSQDANGVSKEKCMCGQHETLDCRKLHKRFSNSCHISGMCDNWMVLSFCKVFGPGVGIY